MKKDRDMMYYGNGYIQGPTPLMNQMQMPPMQNQQNYNYTQQNDLENRLSRIERQIRRLDNRLNRLENPYNNNYQTTELEQPFKENNSMYMV